MGISEKKKVLTVAEVADTGDFGTAKSVYQLILRRQIPFHRRGRRIVFFEDELDEFLAGLPGVTPSEALARQ